MIQPDGSPPRVRGKVLAALMPENRVGITPACAGKRPAPEKTLPGFGDHPRVCGEKRPMSWPSMRPRGSPPRVRGKAISSVSITSAAGITPACAGKRYQRPFLCSGMRDHPRVCGEKLLCLKSWLPRLGSPPRVRGKEYRVKRCSCDDGITPACAGKRRFAESG